MNLGEFNPNYMRQYYKISKMSKDQKFEYIKVSLGKDSLTFCLNTPPERGYSNELYYYMMNYNSFLYQYLKNLLT